MMDNDNLNWEDAEKWIEKSNINKSYAEPHWFFDCGFKLDFDGSLINVSSRFYPPNKNDGIYWLGNYEVYFLGEKILSKKFKSKKLDDLKIKVEKFNKHYSNILKSKIK